MSLAPYGESLAVLPKRLPSRGFSFLPAINGRGFLKRSYVKIRAKGGEGPICAL
jgi:hypothetical protein